MLKHLLIMAFLALPAAPAMAQQFMDSRSIVQALSPQNTGPMVRSMTPQLKRGINVTGQLPPQTDLPRVNLTINFELGSARLTTDGMIALRSLAKALLDPSLSSATFQVAGHTDGRGDATTNQSLSERRAQTVVNHLVNFYDVSRGRIVPVGYGYNRPMDPSNLMNPLNRRVEIINVAPLS